MNECRGDLRNLLSVQRPCHSHNQRFVRREQLASADKTVSTETSVLKILLTQWNRAGIGIGLAGDLAYLFTGGKRRQAPSP